jgi:hypothetical protein
MRDRGAEDEAGLITTGSSRSSESENLLKNVWKDG